MRYLLPLLLSLLFFNAGAKTGSITGTVRDARNKPLPAVNVLLLRAPEGTLIKVALTSAEGQYTFEEVGDGKYMVKASLAGYETITSAPLEITGGPAAFPDMTLQELKKDLKEITVRSQKPVIEAYADKLVMNVENSITATGSTALEVLQRAPGVNVDNNDNISLKGKSGVNIMIDGKLVPLQGADLANMLKGMPSGSIEKIEIISNPGARYDAAGTAGIINIKTKKDKRMGANGTATAGYGQGIYSKYNGGLSLNYRNKKLNVYSSINANSRNGYNGLTLDRRFYVAGAFDGAYVQVNNPTIHFYGYTGTVGADYSLTSKTTVGIGVMGGYNGYKLEGYNHSDVLNVDQDIASVFNTSTSQDNHWRNYGMNLNMRHSFDTAGRELSVDADVAHYGTGSSQDLATYYFMPDGSEQRQSTLLHGNMDGHTDIYSLKADYTHPLKSGLKLEAGLKTSYVTADNEPLFYDRSNGGNVYDSSKSNHFIYHENINAVYVNASRDWAKWSIQAGLRGEQTVARGEQLVSGQNFDRNYFQLFPSVALIRHLNSSHDLGLTLSRRIERPNYQQLNPFKRYLDVTTYNTGNPYLDPALTYSAELSHTYKGQFSTTLSYSRTTDVITQVILPDTLEKVTVVTDKNLAVNTNYSISGTYPFKPFKWWTATASFTGYYTRYEGNLANTELNNGGAVIFLNMNNSFTLPHDWSVELNGWYQSTQQYGYMTLDPMNSIDAGIQKNLWKKLATVKFSVTDIFWKASPSGDNAFTNYREHFVVKRDTRAATLSFVYRFGNRSLAPVRRRHSGAEEELRRAGSGNGG